MRRSTLSMGTVYEWRGWCEGLESADGRHLSRTGHCSARKVQPVSAVSSGGARGIGRELAKDLKARGYDVVIGDLDLAATDATARELGDHATALQLDVTDRVLIATTIAHVESKLGPIDLRINNAGMMPTGRFSDQSV